MEVIFISITDILASEFAKTIKPNNRSTNETIVYGTIIKDSESTSVQIDGSETRTPISTTTDVEDRERVTVLIKDHQAIVTGNTSSPSARNGTVQAINARVVSAEEILALNNNQLQTLAVNYLKVNETLIANTAKIEKLEGDFISYGKAVFEDLEATNARIDKITSTEITTEYLEAHYATIENLKATNARIDKITSTEITTEYLEAHYATIENLKATNAAVETLTAETAKIDTLIFGSASGNVIQTQFANSVIAQLGDAQIKSAMIQDVAASKITAGTIYTDDVTIQSKNGQMILSDNTIQISDSTRVRVQIGKDASGDYSINVWDKSGNLMFSQGGITDKAIKSAIIRNDMVSENANISAGKLNISSLFTEINKSSETIKATKIYLDEEKQTLEVSFKSMTTTVDGLKQTQMSQGTQIEVLSEKISSKIWEQDITTAVKGINVGGTNLLRDTKTLAVKNGFVKYSTTITVETDTNGYAIATLPADGAWDTINFYFPNDVAELVGKEVTLSFDAKSDGLTLTFDQWLFVAAVFNKNNIRLKNKRIAYMNDGAKFNTSDYIDGEWVRCYITFVLPTIEEMTTNVEGEISTYVIQLYSNLNNTTHPLQIRKVKCEFGNKATDWAPAPGDVETDITLLSNKYSILEQDINSFKTTVSATYSTKTELQTTKSTLEQNLNSFKTTVSATYSTKTELQTTKSTLEQNLNSFKTTVSATYTTLDQFNLMEIGGRNILRGTYIKSLSNVSSWEAGGFKATSGGNGVVSVVPIDDSPVKSIDYAVQITGNTSGNRDIAQTGIPYIPGEQYTFSIWVKGTGTLLFRSWNSTTGVQDASIYKRAVSFDKWTRVISTFLSGSTEGSKTIQFGITGSCDSMMFVAPKIEKGNKATDWSPAPEDVDAKINNIHVGGTNLLPDTNVNTLSAVSGDTTRYWSDSGRTDITCEFIELTDPPVKGLKYGVRHSNTVTGNYGRNLTWRASEKIEMEDGEEYTLSCYARVVSGTKAQLRFRFYNTGFQSYDIDIENTEWKRISKTIKVNKSIWQGDYCNIGCGGLVSTYVATVELCGFKLEKGNKATDWSPAPEDTGTAITTVQTIATQTANKFNWLVKNGTSATDFTLTDRMAELTAEIISLNGNVKVNGDMIVKGTITPDKIAIGDFTNLSALNPDTYVPNDPDNYEEYTVVTDDDGSKWFKFGSDTDMAYFHIYLNMLPGSTTFKKGDKYLFRGLMYASAVTSVRICLRVWYSDGGSPTYTNMASVYNDTIPTEQTYIQIPFTINALPTPGRPIQRYGLFLETRNTKLGIIYTRELAVHQMAGNVLIADGAITADKVDVTDLFAQDIVASGSITSPLLKSSDYSYTGGGSGGTEYSAAGMIVDLRNKVIRAPKFCLRADGTICAENGVFSGNITAKSGSITGTLSFGADGSITHTSGNYKVTLRGVRSNTAHGVFYITDNSSGSATYPFMVSGDGSFIATKATITGKITANEGRIGPIIIQNGQGLYFNPTSNTATGFGLWATTAHANIAFHAGANNNNIGGAPFRIYHNGDVVARNIDVQGGKIGYWSVDANGVLAGTSGEMRMELYPKGKNYNVSPSTSDTFFLVIYESGGAVPIGGITRSGWKNVWR